MNNQEKIEANKQFIKKLLFAKHSSFHLASIQLKNKGIDPYKDVDLWFKTAKDIRNKFAKDRNNEEINTLKQALIKNERFNKRGITF